MVLGAQTGVWAASDTSDQKERELTLLMTNSWIDESGAVSYTHLYVWSFCGCIFVLYGYNGEISLQMKGRQC